MEPCWVRAVGFQNKISAEYFAGVHFAPDRGYDGLWGGGAGAPAGLVLSLVAAVPVASRIAKAAKACGLSVHNSSRPESLLDHADSDKIALLLLDFDGCEAQAFALLQMRKARGAFARVPVFGFVSQAKSKVKEEAQRAGCDRVYFKTEFLSNLESLLARSSL
ncbi:MAG: hypothetical protein FGM27_08510 [Candidatus Omnitrophica bacterium]|nr:hypothetical protein [Candidatus Omnitrophota bacterium]